MKIEVTPEPAKVARPPRPVVHQTKGHARSWLLAAVAFSLVTTATADPRSQRTLRDNLATARGVNAQVLRGESVELTLTATVPDTRTPAFFIRSQPQAGRLGELERVPGSPLQARVRYTIPADSEADADEFTFAVRLPGGPMSAAAKVRIRIIEPAPKLEGESLNIGRVPVGSTAAGHLILSNRGTGPWRGLPRLPEPWTGPAAPIEIAPGQRVEIPVRFRPTKLETYRDEFFWQPGQPDSGILLAGTGIEHFSLRPAEKLILRPHPTTGARRGVLVIDPETNATIQLRSEEAARIGLPRSIETTAQQQVELPLQLPTDDLGPLSTTIVASSDFMSRSIAVEAAAVPGKLIINPLPEDRILDLGTIQRGEEVLHKFSIRNIGGAGLRVRINAAPPAFTDLSSDSIVLPPGTERSFSLGLRPGRPGSIEAPVTILHSTRSETITLRAECPEPESRPEPVVVPSFTTGSPTGSDLSPDQTATLDKWARDVAIRGVRLEPVEIDENLPRIDSLRLIRVGRRWVELDWHLPSTKGDVPDFAVELARVMPHPETGEIGHYWLPVPPDRLDLKIRRDGRVIARVSKLPQLSPVAVRVAVRGPSGALGPVSPTARTVTRGPRSWPWWRIGFAVLLAGGAVLGFFVWRQRRQGIR